MTTLDPKLLYQLCEVIEQGSLSRAAESLQLTQPTLSRNIKLIEEYVGSPVLHRGRYGVTPTNVGEQLAEHGRSIHDSMLLANDTVNYWQSGMAGEVRLGVGGMVCASLLPGYLRTHSVLDANYSLSIVTNNTPTLVQKLRENKIDIAMMPSNTYPAQETLSLVPLFSDQVCVVAGEKSPLCAIDGKVDIELLAEQPWMSINHLARIRHSKDKTLHKLKIENVVPKLRFTGDVTAAWRLLRYSTMLTIIPHRLAELFLTTGGVKVLDFDVDMPQRNIAMWMSNTATHETSVLEVANNLKAYFQEANANNDAWDTSDSQALHATY